MAGEHCLFSVVFLVTHLINALFSSNSLFTDRFGFHPDQEQLVEDGVSLKISHYCCPHHGFQHTFLDLPLI